MARATPPKTGAKTRRPGTFGPGADARRGGGKKGRSGRKPVAFITRCAELSDTLALDLVETALRNAVKAGTPLSDPGLQFAVKYVTEYGQTKPTAPQQHQHTGSLAFTLSLGDRPLGPVLDGSDGGDDAE